MSDLVESLAKAMHEAWLEVMTEQGYHTKGACGFGSDEVGARCEFCRDGIVPWEEVPEAVKEVNRWGARAFLKYFNIQGPGRVNVGEAVEALQRLCERYCPVGVARPGYGPVCFALWPAPCDIALGLRALGVEPL